MDVLSPLATFHWRQEHDEWPGGMKLTQAVLLHGRIYIGATVRERNMHNRIGFSLSMGKIYCTTNDFTSWNTLPAPHVLQFALCTYRSQLVVIGGQDLTGKLVGDLWVSDDGTNWQQSEFLPPMLTACRGPAAVNIRSPEYLVVVGGYISFFAPLNLVSVLAEKQWVLVEPLPQPCRLIKFAFHNGNVYFMGNSRNRECCAFYCKVDSLISACISAKSDEPTKKRGLWKTLNMQKLLLFPVSFGKQLTAIRRNRLHQDISELHAYSPFTQSWVHVGDLPQGLRAMSAFVIPTGELMVLCRSFRPRKYTVVKAALRGIQ